MLGLTLDVLSLSDNCAAASALQQAAAAEATPGKVEKVNSFKSGELSVWFCTPVD